MTDARPLFVIARDIRDHWKNISPHAAPYLYAMSVISRITDHYYYDTGEHVVAYFLANASGWRGPEARRLKAELKALLR